MEADNSPQSMLQRAVANQWVKDPTGSYQTQLPSTLEQVFQGEAGKRFGGLVDFQPDVSPTSDYDYRGWWQAYRGGDPRAVTSTNSNDKKLHFPDVWKTPFHHSFSAQSQYASPTAPQWTETEPYRLLAQAKGPVYSPGDTVFDEGPFARNSQPSEIQAAMQLGWPEDLTGMMMPAPAGQSVLSPPSGSQAGAPGYFPTPPGLSLAAILHALSQIR